MEFISALAELAQGRAMILAGCKERLERQAFSAIVEQLAQAGISIFQGTL